MKSIEFREKSESLRASRLGMGKHEDGSGCGDRYRNRADEAGLGDPDENQDMVRGRGQPGVFAMQPSLNDSERCSFGRRSRPFRIAL